MPLALKELVSSDATNWRNAAFCVGEFCRNGGEVALKYPLCISVLLELDSLNYTIFILYL